jgi:hypothetical protein
MCPLLPIASTHIWWIRAQPPHSFVPRHPTGCRSWVGVRFPVRGWCAMIVRSRCHSNESRHLEYPARAPADAGSPRPIPVRDRACGRRVGVQSRAIASGRERLAARRRKYLWRCLLAWRQDCSQRRQPQGSLPQHVHPSRRHVHSPFDAARSLASMETPKSAISQFIGAFTSKARLCKKYSACDHASEIRQPTRRQALGLNQHERHTRCGS